MLERKYSEDGDYYAILFESKFNHKQRFCGCGGIGRHASLRSRVYYNINNTILSIVVTPVKNATHGLLTAKYGYGLASIYPFILLGVIRPCRRR